MKLIKSKYEILEQDYSLGIEGIYEQIELAGRICYKSEGTKYFVVPLYDQTKCDHSINPIIEKAREDKEVICHTSSIGECTFISMDSNKTGEYSGIEGYECNKEKNLHKNLTSVKFVNMLIKRKHFAMLEHGTVYLDFLADNIVDARKRYSQNPYSKIYKNTLEKDWEQPHLYVTTNYRVLCENYWLDDLK